MKATAVDQKLLAAALRDDFPSFVRKVFHTLCPGQVFVPNWDDLRPGPPAGFGARWGAETPCRSDLPALAEVYHRERGLSCVRLGPRPALADHLRQLFDGSCEQVLQRLSCDHRKPLVHKPFLERALVVSRTLKLRSNSLNAATVWRRRSVGH